VSAAPSAAVRAGEEPLFAGPIYGVRGWAVTGPPGQERLAGPLRPVAWPAGGAVLEATCDRGHVAPAASCDCGLHAYHPRAATIRRVFAVRRTIPGVLEAWGDAEVHVDGFRAARGRPCALVLVQDRNPALVARLAAAYGVEVLRADRPQELIELMTARDQGLSAPVVAGLLGDDALAAHARARRRRRREAVARVVAAVLATGALAVAASELLRDPPGGRTLYGRGGEIRVP
jgi:hypothetical protein